MEKKEYINNARKKEAVPYIILNYVNCEKLDNGKTKILFNTELVSDEDYNVLIRLFPNSMTEIRQLLAKEILLESLCFE